MYYFGGFTEGSRFIQYIELNIFKFKNPEWHVVLGIKVIVVNENKQKEKTRIEKLFIN